MTDLENWENGIPLNSAFDEFEDSFQRAKFREASTQGAIQTYKALMYAGLFSRIYQREFTAYGFRILPSPTDGPIQIPHHVFEPRPKVDDAENNVVSASGFIYERVKVVPFAVDEGETVPSIQPESKGPGRTDTYEKTQTVLAQLFKIPSNCSKSAAKLHPDFKAEFERQYPMKDWGVPPPSERTLRTQLTRYRQELEKTGKNISSI